MLTYDLDCCPLAISFCQISQILTLLQPLSSFGLHFLFNLHSCLKAVEFRGYTLSLIPQSRKVLLSYSAKALWELCRFLTSSFAKICFPQLPYIDNDISLLKTIFFTNLEKFLSLRRGPWLRKEVKTSHITVKLSCAWRNIIESL